MNELDPKTFKPLVVLIGKPTPAMEDYAVQIAARGGARFYYPEHKIHHSDMEGRASGLRALTKQYRHVVLVTCSPYFLDHIDPVTDTVLIFVEHQGEIVVRELDKSPDGVWAKQKGVFTLGEIWTAEGELALAGLADTRGVEA